MGNAIDELLEISIDIVAILNHQTIVTLSQNMIKHIQIQPNSITNSHCLFSEETTRTAGVFLQRLVY